LLTIPWLAIPLVMILVSAAFAAIWSLCAPLIGWTGWQMAIRGPIAVLPIALLGWFVLAPWRPRSALDWMTIWLAGTVIRLLLTPLASLALYSAAPCDTGQFVAAVGGCYFAVVLSEVGMIILHLSDRSVNKS